MAHFEGPWIVLNNEEMETFQRRMINPDIEALRRRDAFFEMLENMPFVEHEDGSVGIEFTLRKTTRQTLDSECFSGVVQNPVKGNIMIETIEVRKEYTVIGNDEIAVNSLMAA